MDGKRKDGNTTLDSQIKAVKNYQTKFERVVILLNKGTKSRIEDKYGTISMGAYVRKLIEDDLANFGGR